MVIEAIVEQHVDEVGFLWMLRDAAVAAPHYSLEDLAELDERVEAHLAGCRLSADMSWGLYEQALDGGWPGEVFAAGVLALESRDQGKLEQVAAAAEASPERTRALISALGWVEAETLSGTVPELLKSASPYQRLLGIAACEVHRVDPRNYLGEALADPDPALRARASRTAGALKRRDALPRVREQLVDADEACRFWSAWAAGLMGDESALGPLKTFVNFKSPFRAPALQLALRAMDGQMSLNWLKGLAGDAEQMRYCLQGAGVIGDPMYLPTLIKHMEIPEQARVSGEAFSMITGVDLSAGELEVEAPEGFEAGPSDNPEEEDVAMDPDEDLPWPAVKEVSAWWESNQGAFAQGTRYLCGRPITEPHCRELLRTGYQRQRIAAAYELALMHPEEPLFEYRAPGNRQLKALS